jgi:hypothetical protein
MDKYNGVRNDRTLRNTEFGSVRDDATTEYFRYYYSLSLYIFIFGLFNDAISSSDYIALNDEDD